MRAVGEEGTQTHPDKGGVNTGVVENIEGMVLHKGVLRVFEKGG